MPFITAIEECKLLRRWLRLQVSWGGGNGQKKRWCDTNDGSSLQGENRGDGRKGWELRLFRISLWRIVRLSSGNTVSKSEHGKDGLFLWQKIHGKFIVNRRSFLYNENRICFLGSFADGTQINPQSETASCGHCSGSRKPFWCQERNSLPKRGVQKRSAFAWRGKPEEKGLKRGTSWKGITWLTY